MKFFKPTPFFESDTDEISKISLWFILGFALIYFIATTIFNILLSYFLGGAGSTTAIPSVIAGSYIACAWFTNRFYKKYSRVMSKIEYRYFFKRLVIAGTTIQIIVALAYLALFLLLYTACQTTPDPSCQWINATYDQIPSAGGIILITLFTIAFLLFINALFISAGLKLSIKSIAARKEQKTEKTT